MSEEKTNQVLKLNNVNFLRAYLESASLPLSLVRAAECMKLSSCVFEKPVLDIGCGDGLFASVLFSEPVDVGIDISPVEADRAKSRGAYKEVRTADSSQLPFEDKRFGTVISNCVIEHVEKLHGTFSEAYRVLRPGGRFIFTTHSHLYEDLFFYTRLLNSWGLPWLGKKYARFWTRFWKHQQFMSLEEWSDLLVKVGLEVERSEYYFPDYAVTLFDLLLPFSLPSYICRILTGKWRLRHRTITMKPSLMLLERAYRNSLNGNWCVLMVARRPE